MKGRGRAGMRVDHQVGVGRRPGAEELLLFESLEGGAESQVGSSSHEGSRPGARGAGTLLFTNVDHSLGSRQ